MTTRASGTTSKSHWKWADGKLKVDGVKTSVILKPRLHRKLKAEAKHAGVSLSRYVEDLVAKHLAAA